MTTATGKAGTPEVRRLPPEDFELKEVTIHGHRVAYRVAGTAFEGRLTRRASEERTRLGRALLKAQIAAPLLPRRVSDALSKKCELDSRETRKFHGCDKLSCGLPCT